MPMANAKMITPWIKPLPVCAKVLPSRIERRFTGATIMPSIVPISFSCEMATGKPVMTLIMTVIAMMPGAIKSSSLGDLKQHLGLYVVRLHNCKWVCSVQWQDVVYGELLTHGVKDAG